MRWCAAALLSILACACTHKASRDQCEALLVHYAALHVAEHSPGLTEAAAEAARAKEQAEARGDDNFKNCVSEVSAAEFDCAMHAPTVAVFTRCLE